MTPEEQAEKILTGVSFLSKVDRRNAIKAVAAAIDSEQYRYKELWQVVNQWCLLQTNHPGCLPDFKALKGAVDKRKP